MDSQGPAAHFGAKTWCKKRFADDKSSRVRGGRASSSQWMVRTCCYQGWSNPSLGQKSAPWTVSSKVNHWVNGSNSYVMQSKSKVKREAWDCGGSKGPLRISCGMDHIRSPYVGRRDLQRVVAGRVSFTSLAEKVSFKEIEGRKVRGRVINTITESWDNASI